mmetsp:Transcript_24988/g.69138  ORF Transcript_24988/g.69138 Transcript_24988/m.69138 type:complete len:205 (+) Transcript_24988:101-715(+)
MMEIEKGDDEIQLTITNVETPAAVIGMAEMITKAIALPVDMKETTNTTFEIGIGTETIVQVADTTALHDRATDNTTETTIPTIKDESATVTKANVIDAIAVDPLVTTVVNNAAVNEVMVVETRDTMIARTKMMTKPIIVEKTTINENLTDNIDARHTIREEVKRDFQNNRKLDPLCEGTWFESRITGRSWSGKTMKLMTFITED